jgi:hypothetical protein
MGIYGKPIKATMVFNEEMTMCVYLFIEGKEYIFYIFGRPSIAVMI